MQTEISSAKPQAAELLARTAGKRPLVLKIVKDVGLVQLVLLCLFGVLGEAPDFLNYMTLFFYVMLGGGLLHLLWAGSRFARVGYSAFHAAQLLLVTAAYMKLPGHPVLVSMTWIAVVLSAVPALMLWHPRMSAWIREVKARRDALSDSEKKVMSKTSAFYGFIWLMSPFLVFQLGQGTMDLSASMVAAATTASFGILVLTAQAMKLYAIRKRQAGR